MTVDLRAFEEARTEVLLFAKRMLAERLVYFTSGNISRRVHRESRLIAVTPAATPYDTMGAEDLAIVDLEGEVIDARVPPTSELPLHILTYQGRPEVGAIIHAHSPAAMAMAARGQTLPPIFPGLVAAAGGAIATARYASSGSAEMAQNAAEALADRSACFLHLHGLLAIGPTLFDAYAAASVVETAADAFLRALAVGAVDELPSQEVERIRRERWNPRWTPTDRQDGQP